MFGLKEIAHSLFQPIVIISITYQKIGIPIVITDSIYVMDNFIFSKRSSKGLSSN